MNVTDSIIYVGVEDRTIDLFESQYPVPHGVTYNSYVIMDDHITIMDTVDKRATQEWLDKIKDVLQDKEPEYLVVSHMEPDHGSSVASLAKEYSNMKIVGNVKTFTMIDQFFPGLENERVVVKEGETLELGQHTLKFIMAPMVHWPEVMMSYEISEKVLFSADAFGTFGTLDHQENWMDEARRYYLNIVGKYGMQVQTVLKKAAQIDIDMICPLHGPVLKEDLSQYICAYQTWSQYLPEESVILLAYASIHGYTKDVVMYLADLLKKQGENIELVDLCREDVSYAVAKAFKYDRMILASSTYDGSMFCPMETFLHHLKSKNFQKRTIGLIENGSWAPMANKAMKSLLETMKDIEIVEPTITVRSSLSEENKKELEELVKTMVEGGCQDEVCM